ncbi:hypothetical protein GNZ13_45190 [Paraburkholderia sp. 5N]|uniref:DNA-binding protein n=1 Tax=Paraburkholderia elongata TaxID=2675747 RepID=A0A972SPY7_9BURK|nr:hypothetical protein [Paraburkholderia elongata]
MVCLDRQGRGKEVDLTASNHSGVQTEPVETVPFMPDIFESTAEGGARLRAGRCTSCGALSFPRRTVCVHCGPGHEIEVTVIEGGGTVYASTVVRVPSPVGLKAPYAYGYVDLNDVPLRVFGLFAQADAGGLTPGTPVRLVAENLCRDAAGRELVAYKFASLKGATA